MDKTSLINRLETRQVRDLTLLNKIILGDAQAMEQLLTHYKGLVRRKASTMYMAGADAEDVIQEGMIGLFKAVRDYRADLGVPFASFAGYCIMAQVTDAVRQASRQKHRPLNESVSLQSLVSQDDDQDVVWQDLLPASDQFDPEQQLLSREQSAALYRFIQTDLTPLERRTALLYLQNLTYQQIATCLGCPTKSVDNALRRVRRKLKSL